MVHTGNKKEKKFIGNRPFDLWKFIHFVAIKFVYSYQLFKDLTSRLTECHILNSYTSLQRLNDLKIAKF